MIEQYSDEIIIRKCLNNESVGWDALVNKYYKLIYNKIYHTLHSINCYDLNQFIDDIYQEVFLKILSAFTKKREITNLKAWVSRIAYTTTIDYLRKHFKDKKIFTDEPVEDIINISDTNNLPEKTLLNKETVEKINNAINILSDKEQIILKLFYYHELKYDEIANIINTSTGSIGGIKSNAEKKLYKILVEKEKFIPDLKTLIILLYAYMNLTMFS